MSRWTPEEHKRIDDLRTQIARLAREFRGIVKPSEEEIKYLLEDVQTNPEIYTSYFEEDDLFLAENIYDEVVAQEEQ